MLPLSLQYYFEFLALICGIVFWKNIKHSPLRWFVPYLLFIILVELSGRYIRMIMKTSNAWLYNISVPIEYLFFSYIFFKHFKNNTNRNVVKGFMLLFSVYVIVTLLIRGIRVFNTNTLLLGSFSMIILALFFLIELYERPGIINLTNEPLFWIAVGLLLFNAGEFSYDLLSEFFFTNKLDTNAALFRSINKYLNLLLYLCISISFLWKKDSVT